MTRPARQRPPKVVAAFLDPFEAMDFVRRTLADGVEYTNVPIGTVHGHAGVREVLEPSFAPIEENEFVIVRRADAGEVVFVERLDRHRLADGWRELPVNSVFDVHDGTITVWRDSFDLALATKIHEADASRA